MINKFTKTFFVASAIIFMSSVGNLNAANSRTRINTAENTVNTTTAYCGVSESEIINYLAGFGYHIVKVEPIEGTCNAIGRTLNNKQVIVVITEGQIVGHIEIDL